MVMRGTASLLGFLLAVMSILSVLAFQRADDVNTFLGLKAPTQINADEETQRFRSEFSENGLLTEDGIQNMISAADAFVVRQEEEGAVLLLNRNDALPLRENERKVTLFGRSVADPIYKNKSGGPLTVGSERLLSFHDAFTQAGFQINETLFSAYASSSVSRVKYGTDTVTKIGGDQPATIGEVDASFYTDSLKATFGSYGDAAIVMFSREAGEGTDVVSDVAHVKEGVPQLSLHKDEADLLKMIKASGNFKKTIVLINSGNIMDLDWLNDYETYGVDACLLVGQMGTTGSAGIVNLLTGAAVPSGKLSATAAMDSMSSPAMQNMGDYEWENLSYLLTNRNNSSRNEKYIVYAEGIYVGYKYYESRYYDSMLGQYCASDPAGRTEQHIEAGVTVNPYPEDITGWDYGVEMAFPFGYGLSYTTFRQQLLDMNYDAQTDLFTATVGVTNTGDRYSGKSVVQLYLSAPYTQYDRDNLVEKSAIMLVGFGKTDVLAPGESQQVTIQVPGAYLASYDSRNAKTYILDEGNYYFAIGSDAHDAVNNVLTCQVEKGEAVLAETLIDQNGDPATGDASQVWVHEVSQFDRERYATGENGYAVTNVMEGDAASDINEFLPGAVTYLTRGGNGSNWADSYPTTAKLTVTDEMIRLLDGYTYETPEDAKDVSAVTLNKDAGLKLTDMIGVAYDDPKWDTFVQQMNVSSLLAILDDYKGFSEPVEQIGRSKVIHHSDGPNGLEIKYDMGESRNATCYASEAISSSSWNVELIQRQGELMGEECLYSGTQVFWGPGINIHRTPYSGRNFEYYSEDPILSLSCVKAVTTGLSSKGVITGGKHLVCNDQEVNRNGVATFLTEQTIRELYLKPFEVLKCENIRNVMCSENRIGLTATSLHEPLLRTILRKEWGYDGIIISDAANDLDYMHPEEGLAAGTDMWCLTKKYAMVIRKAVQTDANLIRCLQESNKRIYYAYVNSNYMNGVTTETTVESWTPWWKPVVIVVNVVTAAAFLTCTVLFVKQSMNERKKKA